MKRLRILAAAASLPSFTITELVAYSGENEDYVRSIVHDRDRDLFKEVGEERSGRGRPAKRYAPVDREQLMRWARDEAERLDAVARPPRSRDEEADRLAAVLSAEAALLRAWSPREAGQRHVLADTALLNLEAASNGDDPYDPIRRRVASVRVFAQLTAAPELATDVARLSDAAVALVELSESAPERVHGFLRGLTEIALEAGALPPLAIVTAGEPKDAIPGMPDGIEWVRRDVPGTSAGLWAQRWSELLVERELLAGLVVHEAQVEQLKHFADWHVTLVVVSENHSVEFIKEMTRHGAYYLPAAPRVGEVAETLVNALEQAPETTMPSADAALGGLHASRDRSELAGITDGRALARRRPRHTEVLLTLLDPEVIDKGLGRAELGARIGLLGERGLREAVGNDLDLVLDDGDPGSGRDDVWRIRREAGVLLALDFGIEHVRAAKSDLRAKLRRPDEAEADGDLKQNFHEFRGKYPRVNEDVPRALDAAADMLRELVGDRSPDDIVGIGVALAHPVDAATGKRMRGMQPGNQWNDLSPVEELRERLEWECPILPINDANAGVLSEARFGNLRGYSDCWYVRWTAGIGAGGLVNGQLCTGVSGIAGELGHLPVILTKADRDSQPPKCDACGHWCLESRAGVRAITEALGRPSASLEVLLRELAGETGEYPEEVILAAEYMGQALGQLATLLNPRRVVIGGEFGTPTLERLHEHIVRGLGSHALSPARHAVKIVHGKRTGRAVLEGALVHVLQEEVVPYLLRRAFHVSGAQREEGVLTLPADW